MPKLVHKDRSAEKQDDQKRRPDVGHERVEQVEGHGGCNYLISIYLRISTSRPAIVRASLSAARTAARSVGSKLAIRSRAWPTIFGIARKGIRPLRNASTATSFAALKTAGATPPATMDSRAKRIIG